MALTETQRAAIEFIFSNPGAEPHQVVEAAGTSSSGHKGAEFIWGLIESGAVRLECDPVVRVAIEEGEEW